MLTGKQVRRGIHRGTRELEQAIRHYRDTYNKTAKPFVWTKTADQILASVARFVSELQLQDTSIYLNNCATRCSSIPQPTLFFFF